MTDWAYIDGKYVDMIPVRAKRAEVDAFCAEFVRIEGARG